MANSFENSTNSWNSAYTMPELDLGRLSGSGGGFWGGLGDIAGKYGPQLISGLAGGLAGGFGGNNSQSIGPKQIGNLIASQNLINTYDQTQNYLAFNPMTRLNSARDAEEKYKKLEQTVRYLGPGAYTAALATDQYDRNAGSKNSLAFNIPFGPSGSSLAEMSTNPGNTFDIAKTNAYQNTDPLFAQTAAFTGLGARRA